MTAEIYSPDPKKEKKVLCKRLKNGETAHILAFDIVAICTNPEYTRITFKDNPDDLIESYDDYLLERKDGLVSVNIRSGQFVDFCDDNPIKIAHVDSEIVKKRRPRTKISR